MQCQGERLGCATVASQDGYPLVMALPGILSLSTAGTSGVLLFAGVHG
jgi:hypothetical protein